MEWEVPLRNKPPALERECDHPSEVVPGPVPTRPLWPVLGLCRSDVYRYTGRDGKDRNDTTESVHYEFCSLNFVAITFKLFQF